MYASLIALAAAANGFSLPHAGIELANYIQRHAPKSVDREGLWTVTEVEVFVDPKGKILECALKRVAGDMELAKALCSISVGQQISAPRDFASLPVHAASRMILTAFPDYKPNPAGQLGGVENERLEISLQSAPKGAPTIPLVGLRLLIDANGFVSSCEVVTEVSTELKSVACQQASVQRWPAKLSKAKLPVPYIKTLVVEFASA